MDNDDKTYYEVLSKAYHESSVQFDKQILFISSGALGLSFTFIKDIVKDKEVNPVAGMELPKRPVEKPQKTTKSKKK